MGSTAVRIAVCRVTTDISPTKWTVYQVVYFILFDSKLFSSGPLLNESVSPRSTRFRTCRSESDTTNSPVESEPIFYRAALSLSLAVIKVGGSILLRRVYKYVFILNINFSSEGMCSDGSSETSSIRIITARRPLYFLTYSIINLNPSNFLDSFDGA